MNEEHSLSNKNCCIKAWKSLITQLHKSKSFRVNTGNINNYIELKQKQYANSAEELCACLNLQFSNLPEDTKIAEGETIMLADKKHREPLYERDDLKITLKLFVKDFRFESIRDAVQSTMTELQIDTIEQLIIAFPTPDETSLSRCQQPVCLNGNNTECSKASQTDETIINEPWLEAVLRIWEQIDTDFVTTQKVFSVGVADFDLATLRALYDAAKLKPCADHFNTNGYCELSPELRAFAHDNDIQLLTHNDPNPFPLADVFHSFCLCDRNSDNERENRCSRFLPVWAARYTVWVRRRSLMAAKGYIVEFQTASSIAAKQS